MVRAWPALVGRAHAPAQLLGTVVLTALLAVTLAFSWRDGVPADGHVDAVAPTQSAIAKPFRASQPPVVVVPAAPPKAQIPTAPPVPVLFLIPSLNVHRPVEKVGVDQFGVMNLPANAWNAGWFEDGPVPGAPGDAVIEGHAGYPGKPMMFGKLYTLRPGDRIVVVMSDRSRLLFIVVSMASLPRDSAPENLAEPSGPARLTLITCTGSFNKKSYSYSERLLVEARYAGLA
jgi:LPXTG-site transpeptidase (sortase) family protein